MTSLEATIAQGGKAGSATHRLLSQTSAVNKNRHSTRGGPAASTSSEGATRAAGSAASSSSPRASFPSPTAATSPQHHEPPHESNSEDGGASTLAGSATTSRFSRFGTMRSQVEHYDPPEIDLTDAYSGMGGSTGGDSDGEDNFDMVNPLFEHAGAATHTVFASGPDAPTRGTWGVARLKRCLRRLGATPKGRIVVTIERGEALTSFTIPVSPVAAVPPTPTSAALGGSVTPPITPRAGSTTTRPAPPTSLDPVVRISYNGQTASTLPGASTGGGVSPRWTPPARLEILHYTADYDRNLSEDDLDESTCSLEIEVSDSVDDSFIGSCTLANVESVFSTRPKALALDLTTALGVPRAGMLHVTIEYHKYSFLETMGLRGKRLMDAPNRAWHRAKLWGKSFQAAAHELGKTGLDGVVGGGVGSWVVLLALLAPYVVLTLLTNWSWAVRSWFVVLPVYGYLYLSFPVIFAWIIGTLISSLALHGGGCLKFGSLSVYPWIRDYSLHLRITAKDIMFQNPPGFPLENFFQSGRIDMQGSVPLRHLLDICLLRYKSVQLKSVKDFYLLAKFDIEFVEVEDFLLDFQLYNGELNVAKFGRALATAEARNMGWLRGYMKRSDPTPNEIEIRIIRAKDLSKTRTSKSTVLANQALDATRNATAGQFGRNAVMEAFFDDGGDEDDEQDAGEDEVYDAANYASDKPEYMGGGPPAFNPMDHMVKARAKQGAFDPYVVVQVRRDTQKTHTQTKTNSPMWNETFHFHANDPSAVLHVMVMNREVVGRDVLLGQWLITIKYMLGNPRYCWHEKGMTVSSDRWMRGWFPLMNKRFRGIGKCGKIEMAMQWRYVPEARLKRPVSFPAQTALQQMQANSDETRLRMGDMRRVAWWLRHEPFLFDIRRVTVRNVRVHVQDLFRGKVGAAEKFGVEKSQHIFVQRVDFLSEFRPKHGDLGITTYKVVFAFFRHMGPRILETSSSHARVGNAIGQIVSSATVGVKESIQSSVRHLFHGDVQNVGAVKVVTNGLKRVTKSVDRGMQLLHRTVTQNEKDGLHYKIPVRATDEDFLLTEIDFCGHLGRFSCKAVAENPLLGVVDEDMERATKFKGMALAQAGGFKTRWYELRGRTLFFRASKTPPGATAMFALTYKLELGLVDGAIYFVDAEEIVLNCRLSPSKEYEGGSHIEDLEGIYFTRLREPDPKTSDDKISSDNPTLAQWMEKLKEKGVPCVTLKRG